MKRATQVIVVIAIPLLVGATVGTAGCSSGRATSDASATGKGGDNGGAGRGGRGGGSGGGTGGAGGIAGTGGGGTGGAGGTGGGSGNGGRGGGTGGGGGSGSGDAGTTPCGNTAACTADQICVRTVIGGATYICPDGGGFNPGLLTCPAGATLDANGCCFGAESRSYGCVARPSGCGATVTCACASTLCNHLGACTEVGASDEIACLSAGT
jgi:hypothetical protein